MIPADATSEVATLGIALGLVFSLICHLTTNLSPGGVLDGDGFYAAGLRVARRL